jgi:NADH-quinone oxidoreductase subunit E
MAVRRLAEKQPESFAFSTANLAWAEKEIAKYPPGRQASAVISLLWRAQEQEGWISEPAIRVVGEMLGMPRIRVLEVATFYTMFLLEPVGRIAHIQVCGTTPCWLRGSDAIKDVCRHKIHHEQFHISADGAFSWEEVECLGACVNAPLVQIRADTYEDLTAESFEKLLADLGSGRPVKAGPQIDRQFAAPVGGPTTLTDEALYRPRATASAESTGPALTDSESKKPTEGASDREAPAPKAPLADNPANKNP